jgi:hypothetical protein
MSLNLSEKAAPSASNYCTSPEYVDAVNDAQFVRMFGIAALVASVVMLIRPEVTIGIGMAVLGFGKTRYYRMVGLTVIVTSIVGILVGVLRPLGSTCLCIGVGWKGMEIIGVLANVARDDPDWLDTRKRAIVGICFCAVGLLINAAWVLLMVIALLT